MTDHCRFPQIAFNLRDGRFSNEGYVNDMIHDAMIFSNGRIDELEDECELDRLAHTIVEYVLGMTARYARNELVPGHWMDLTRLLDEYAIEGQGRIVEKGVKNER